MADLADELADHFAHATGVLFRSRTEIDRILQTLLRDGTVVATDLEQGERLFLSRLLCVDPNGEFLVIAYSQDKIANSTLLAQASVTFHASDKGAHMEFRAFGPSETLFGGAAAIRFAFPQALVCSQRREHARIPVPSDVSLRCVADSTGAAPFEARIIDISLGGVGGMVYDAKIRLPAGTVLKDCKIVAPHGEAILVDLEVRYTVAVLRSDGGLASRSGVRFLSRPAGIEALINVFVRDLGKGVDQ